ncbi:transporter particle component [Colletotrichum tofieldiae]|nr:transporter particle component [Colletotrichum tofieldiae]
MIRPGLFDHQAVRLKKSVDLAKLDEFMIIDNGSLISVYTNEPRENSQLNYASDFASIGEGFCDGASFPAKG